MQDWLAKKGKLPQETQGYVRTITGRPARSSGLPTIIPRTSRGHRTSASRSARAEDALLDHEAVESAGVVGVHDLLHGENVRAYVTIREGAARPTAQALIEFARARVGYKAPEEIEFLAEMPLNPTGKVDRGALKRMAAGRHAVAGVP